MLLCLFWLCLSGPIVYSVVSPLAGHALTVAIVGFWGLTCWLENRPRLLTFVAAEKTVVFTERSGAESAMVLAENPSVIESVEHTGYLYFAGERGRRYKIAVSHSDDDFDQLIGFLGDYLGLPSGPTRRDSTCDDRPSAAEDEGSPSRWQWRE